MRQGSAPPWPAPQMGDAASASGAGTDASWSMGAEGAFAAQFEVSMETSFWRRTRAPPGRGCSGFSQQPPTTRVAVFHADRKILCVAKRPQLHARRAPRAGSIVGKLAVQPLQLPPHARCDPPRQLVAAIHPPRQLHREPQLRIARRILLHFQHELARQLSGKLRLLDAGGDVLGIHVRSIERHREVRPPEHVHEGQRRLRSLFPALELDAVLRQKIEHLGITHDPTAIENPVAHERRSPIR